MSGVDGAVTHAALAAELLNSNLRNYAAARLRNLPPPVRGMLLDAMCDGQRPKTLEAEVTALLMAKAKIARLERLQRRQPSPPPASPTSPPPAALCSPRSPVSPASPTAAPASVLAPARKLRILTFNALKLRVDAPGLVGEWDELARVFNACDVVVLQEVSASVKLFQPRFLDGLLAKMRRLNVAWRYVRSEPSGASARDCGLEVHVVLYKPPVELKSGVVPTTLATVGGVAMSHAPLVVSLQAHGLEFNVVSVHLPPASTARRPERDAQLRALFRYYPLQASLRNQRIFRRDGRRFVLHILAGDFNASPGELRSLAEQVAPRTWTRSLLGDKGAATAAKRGYDNFLANFDDAFYADWTPGVEVLRLARHANFSKSEPGVSDHSPVVLTLTQH